MNWKGLHNPPDWLYAFQSPLYRVGFSWTPSSISEGVLYLWKNMSWDAISFCRDYHIPFTTSDTSTSGKVTSGWIGIRCPNPRCRGDKPDLGGFNLIKGYYFCWACGGHSIPRVLGWILHISSFEANKIKDDYEGRNLLMGSLNNKKLRKTGKAKKVELPGGPLKLKHKKYLEGRNFDPDFLEAKYNLLGTLGKGKTLLERQYKNRIIIPIYDQNNRLISFQGRDITGEHYLKYKGCTIEKSVVNYKDSLYGIHLVDGTKIGVVEGVFDQWALGDNFVCTFGTSMTPAQTKLLARFDTIYFLFDPETTAQKKAEKVAIKLASLGKTVEVIDLGIEKDPAELEISDRKAIRRELGFV
jgi:hypothetical protein